MHRIFCEVRSAPQRGKFSPLRCRYQIRLICIDPGGEIESSRLTNSVQDHIFAISSLLFLDWMYNAASVLMRHSSRNAHSATAPASLAHRNSYLAALPDTYCAGMEQTRSGTHGGRENGKRQGR